jgi:predicted anti-sigma-YlaC factor YlaD
MNCEKVSELLPQLLAGALKGYEEQEALTHLSRCGECRGELAFWASVSGAVLAEKDEMPKELFREIREELMGPGASTVLESLRATRQALGLVGSAFRLAFSAAGMNA